VNKPIFSDMATCVTTIIKHPTDIVWPQVLEQAAWMKDFNIQTIEGERNQEGEIKKVSPILPDFPHFFFKTLLLVPFRKFVYKAYTDNRSGQYGFTGIEVLSLVDVGKESAVTFEAYLEIQSSTMTCEELTDFVGKAKEGSLAVWERNFQRLASLIADTRTR
jgi:hypothetical protein